MVRFLATTVQLYTFHFTAQEIEFHYKSIQPCQPKSNCLSIHNSILCSDLCYTAAFFNKKKNYVAMWRKSEPEGNSPPFSLYPLPMLEWLKTSVSTQTHEEESRGPWYATGPALESVESLSLAQPPCLFALTSHSLPGCKSCFMKGAIVLREGGGRKKNCCKYLSYREGIQSPQPARLEY